MNKNFKKIIIPAVFVVLVIVFLVMFFRRNAIIRQQREEISIKQSIIASESEANSALQATIEDGTNESYVEQVARDRSYVYPEERVYYDSDAE